jgi:hypothetical protein
VHPEGVGEFDRGTQSRFDIGWVIEMVVAEPYRHGEGRQLDDVSHDQRLSSLDGGVDGELGGTVVERHAEEGDKKNRPTVAPPRGAGRR